MANQFVVVILHLVSGTLVGLLGALIARYPEASYAIRTGWKHEDATLSSGGRTDQRLMGVILVFVGLGIVVVGLT